MIVDVLETDKQLAVLERVRERSPELTAVIGLQGGGAGTCAASVFALRVR